MSTAAETRSVAGRRRPHAAAQGHVTFPRLVRSEWLKLTSLRSTWWVLGLTFAIMVLFALINASSVDYLREQGMEEVLASMHPAELVATGFQFAMFTIAVLGALTMTGEYGTGMIRSTFTAAPWRLRVLAAKALVLVVVAVLISALSLAVAHVVTMPMLSAHDLVPSLGEPETWQVYGGMTYFLVAVALLSLAVGTIVRATAGAITIVVTVLMLLPIVLQFITLDWVQDVSEYLPVYAMSAFFSPYAGSSAVGGEGAMGAWEGVAVVAAWAIVPLVLAMVLLRRRDA